jgi:hypothetical protein
MLRTGSVISYTQVHTYVHFCLKIVSSSSKCQACTVSRPSVVTEHLSAAHLTLPEVLRHSAADLREGGSHDLSEVSLWIQLVHVNPRLCHDVY